jgi:hypothetical protein
MNVALRWNPITVTEPGQSLQKSTNYLTPVAQSGFPRDQVRSNT